MFCHGSAECLRQHKPHHVGWKPAVGGGPLRVPADQTDLRTAGAGVESFRSRSGREERPAGDVRCFPPEMRPGQRTCNDIIIMIIETNRISSGTCVCQCEMRSARLQANEIVELLKEREMI